MIEGQHRIDQLADRVRWLDRHRRRLAILVALIIASALMTQLSTSWPQVNATPLFVAVAFVAWALTEIVLAYVTALYETECDQLTHDRGLPRAIVRK